jgi:MFS family permease
MEDAPDACKEKRVLSDTFRKRDFGLSLLVMFFAFLSHTLFYLFPLFLEQFQPSKTWVGLIMGVYSLTAILIRPFFGRITDEWGPRKMTVYSLIAMFVVVPWFHLVHSAGMLAFMLRALMGVGWGINLVAVMALCTDLAPRDRLAHSLGVIGVSGIVAGAIGPMLAEEIVRYFGFPGLFNMSLVFLVVAGVCTLAMKEAPRMSRPDRTSKLLILRRYPLAVLGIIAIMPVIHGAARGSVINFIALFGKSAGFDRVAPFFIAFSAAAVLTRLGIGDVSDRYGRKKVILPSAIIISGNLFWIAGMESYTSFIICGFLAGLGQGLIFPALSAYLIDFLGHEHKSFALALYMSLFDAGMGLGSPVFGWISDIAGYRPMYVVAGILLLGYSVLFTFKSPKPAMRNH